MSLEIIRIDEIKITELSNLEVIQISNIETNNLSANKSNSDPISEVWLYFRASKPSK